MGRVHPVVGPLPALFGQIGAKGLRGVVMDHADAIDAGIFFFDPQAVGKGIPVCMGDVAPMRADRGNARPKRIFIFLHSVHDQGDGAVPFRRKPQVCSVFNLRKRKFPCPQRQHQGQGDNHEVEIGYFPARRYICFGVIGQAALRSQWLDPRSKALMKC